MTALHVLRVFCDEQGRYGNPLGVVLDAGAIGPEPRQRIAHRLGFSETVFVDDAKRGELRIFTPTVELPLAGHPLVGSSWLLARVAGDVGRAAPTVLRPPAGDVATGSDPQGAWIEANPQDAPPFTLVEHPTPEAIGALEVEHGPDVHANVWAWIDPAERTAVRCRVFADGVGIPEDEATGSAALRLIAALDRPLVIRQGRGSVIVGRPVDGGRVRVGGRVVEDHVVALEAVLDDPAELARITATAD